MDQRAFQSVSPGDRFDDLPVLNFNGLIPAACQRGGTIVCLFRARSDPDPAKGT